MPTIIWHREPTIAEHAHRSLAELEVCSIELWLERRAHEQRLADYLEETQK